MWSTNISARSKVSRVLGIVLVVAILLSLFAAIGFTYNLLTERREAKLLTNLGYRFFFGSRPERAEDAAWYLRVTQVYCPDDNLDSSLARLGNFPFLKMILLSQCQFSESRLEFLTHLRRLDNLLMWDTPLGDTGAIYVSRCKNLRELNVSQTKITDKGLARIAELPELLRLDLSDTAIEGKLSIKFDCAKLEYIDVVRTRIGDEFVRNILSCQSLKRIDLTDTKITNQAIRYLATMPHLVYLSIQSTAVDDDALNDIQRIKSLQAIDVTFTRISDAGHSWLEKACPQLDLIDGVR